MFKGPDFRRTIILSIMSAQNCLSLVRTCFFRYLPLGVGIPIDEDQLSARTLAQRAFAAFLSFLRVSAETNLFFFFAGTMSLLLTATRLTPPFAWISGAILAAPDASLVSCLRLSTKSWILGVNSHNGQSHEFASATAAY